MLDFGMCQRSKCKLYRSTAKALGKCQISDLITLCIKFRNVIMLRVIMGKDYII